MPLYNPAQESLPGVKYSYMNMDIPAGNTVATTLVANPETTFASSFIVPAGGITPGTVIDVWAAGVFSSLANAASLTLKLKVAGTTVASISAPLNLLTSNKGWTFDTWSHVLSDGKVESQGQGNFAGSAMSINNSSSYTINSAVDMPVSLTAQFGAVGLGNSIQLRQLIVSVSG
jgi:hypothetical protein